MLIAVVTVVVAMMSETVETHQADIEGSPPWRPFGDVGRKTIMDARWRAFGETVIHAPASLKDRLLRAATRTTLNDAKVHIARVRFESWRFEFDTDGEWAVIAPICEGGEIVDLAAFAVDNDEKRQVYGVGHFAVGLEDATFDLRLHPSGKMLVHYSVWTWLRAECTGLLPVRWYRTTMHIKSDLNCRLVFDNEIDAYKAEAKIHKALCLPEIFVQARAA